MLLELSSILKGYKYGKDEQKEKKRKVLSLSPKHVDEKVMELYGWEKKILASCGGKWIK